MRKRIGSFLIEKGVITELQVQDILRYSARTGLRFGEAALEMKILTQEKLIEVFGPSYGVNFFHLEPGYFPKDTKSLLPTELVLRLGAVPLGYKTEYGFFKIRRKLNLGLLDPSRSDAIEEIQQALKDQFSGGKIKGFKIFLVLADQFIGILREVYGVSEENLKDMKPQMLDPTLAMFLNV